MGDDEKKQPEQEIEKPEGESTPSEGMPNQKPDETSQKIAELEAKIKEKDTQLSDMSTTVSTIEKRYREVNEKSQGKVDSDELQARAKNILENAAYDPESASKELASLIGEVTQKASKTALTQAQQSMKQEAALNSLKASIKQKNPHFDDDVVDTIIQKADILAGQGKAKTAEDAINQATDFIKSKFDNYAKQVSAASQPPELPEGARAEIGINKEPEKPKVETVPTPEQELQERQGLLQKKVL